MNTTKEIREIAKRAFPDYRGRKISVDHSGSVTLHDTNWGGGTQNTYVAVNRSGKTAAFSAPAPWVNAAEGETVEVPANVAVVVRSVFYGREAGVRVYLSKTNIIEEVTR